MNKEREQPSSSWIDQIQDYAIFTLDADGRVTTWNLGGKRILGYKAEEILGRHISDFYPEKEIRGGMPGAALNVAFAEGRREEEGWKLRKDRSRFWANLVTTALRETTVG